MVVSGCTVKISSTAATMDPAALKIAFLLAGIIAVSLSILHVLRKFSAFSHNSLIVFKWDSVWNSNIWSRVARITHVERHNLYATYLGVVYQRSVTKYFRWPIFSQFFNYWYDPSRAFGVTSNGMSYAVSVLVDGPDCVAFHFIFFNGRWMW